MTITGYAAFQLLIPAACILWAVSVFFPRQYLKNVAAKLAIFGFAIALVIPVSVKVSDFIEKTYQSSIEETLETAKQTTKEIEENAKETEQTEGFLSGFFSKVKEEITGATVEIINRAEQILQQFFGSAGSHAGDFLRYSNHRLAVFLVDNETDPGNEYPAA